MSLAPMPELESLMRRGTVYERPWLGQIESWTPVGHATISTGALPRHHGIIGFEWLDPTTGQEDMDGWDIGSSLGSLGRDIHRAHPACIPQAIKRANPNATVVALSSEKYYAADAMGAHTADYVLYHRQEKGHLRPAHVRGQAPPRHFVADPDLHLVLPFKHFTDWDHLAGKLAIASLQEFAPQALMINLPGADVYGHPYGGPASPHIMARVVAGLDRNIGRIVAAYKQAGIFDKTLFVVTADHGMIPNTHTVTSTQVNVAIDRAGASSIFHTGGTAQYVYLEPESRPRAAAVARELNRIPGVVGGYIRTRSGSYEAINTRPGPALDAAFRYLISTFWGPSAPDVVAPFRENTMGTVRPYAYGNHGGLSWGVQTIPLVFAGPGVRAGTRSQAAARLIDVAPTILKLMGIPAGDMDGIPLADALVDPPADAVHAQTSIDRELRHHRDALRDSAERDLWNDRQARLAPPPSLPPRP
jgi:arylsulfatase A-like enzyme